MSIAPKPAPGWPFCRGFTLTEVLVVLVIMGLAMSLSVVQFEAYIQRSKTQIALRHVVDLIQRTQVRSFTTNRAHRIDQAELDRLANLAVENQAGERSARGSPQADIETIALQPILIGPDGACNNGSVSVTVEERQFLIKVYAPFCETEVLHQNQDTP